MNLGLPLITGVRIALPSTLQVEAADKKTAEVDEGVQEVARESDHGEVRVLRRRSLSEASRHRSQDTSAKVAVCVLSLVSAS